MIFLIDYDRKKGCLEMFKSFEAALRPEAQRERLERELSLNSSRGSREVILLEADDERTLHRTHQRYFKTAREIIESMAPSESTDR